MKFFGKKQESEAYAALVIVTEADARRLNERFMQAAGRVSAMVDQVKRDLKEAGAILNRTPRNVDDDQAEAALAEIRARLAPVRELITRIEAIGADSSAPDGRQNAEGGKRD